MGNQPVCELVETTIADLKIRINKVIEDQRGFLCELAPKGLNDELLVGGVRNIYASTAIGKGKGRGGHYHEKNIESFFTLSGTALWFFHDFRQKSPTFDTSYAVILGLESPEDMPCPVYTVSQSKMAQVSVPPGVYHVFYPLTDKPVTVVALASEGFDKNDYVYPEVGDKTAEILKKLVGH